ncbi:hypothetical protein B296_00023942 [Ensete ventricosum]|uniref:Uncharacterized protein n=1 Tax=Ensete ventricosum TaxID=4639 RepID=A0A426Z061_ENSVE|nr:hypothetical protein B296_00023942 [Ensete ventricosum]
MTVASASLSMMPAPTVRLLPLSASSVACSHHNPPLQENGVAPATLLLRGALAVHPTNRSFPSQQHPPATDTVASSLVFDRCLLSLPYRCILCFLRLFPPSASCRSQLSPPLQQLLPATAISPFATVATPYQRMLFSNHLAVNFFVAIIKKNRGKREKEKKMKGITVTSFSPRF